MGQWDVYNQTLIYLHAEPTKFVAASHNNAVCHHLCMENLAFSTEQEITNTWGALPQGSTETVYAIHPNGIHLFSILPEEYTDRPYEYFLKLKQDQAEAETNFKELIKQVNIATLRSAESVTETAVWTKYLFWATLAIALGTFALAIYPLYPGSSDSKRLLQIERRVEQLDNRTSQKSQSTSSGPVGQSQKRLKDSITTASGNK